MFVLLDKLTKEKRGACHAIALGTQERGEGGILYGAKERLYSEVANLVEP
jgi:hypothetical protein